MIECRQLSFRYPGDTFSLAIDSLSIAAGEKVAIIGPSGCGKTTLLKLISGMLSPADGTICLDGQDLSALSRSGRQAHRIRHIGLVQQQFELLDYLTVRENILLPYRVTSALTLDSQAHDRAEQLMQRVGIEQHGERYPQQLSQGERQRTAICRGLVTAPQIILADEPTGNLDPTNQSKTVELLLEQADQIGATVVMVTHEPTLLPHFERTIDLLELRKEANA